MATPTVPLTARLKPDQTNARAAGRSMTAETNGVSETILHVQDESFLKNAKPLYIYNISEMEHVHLAPPSEFAGFKVEACEKGQPFFVKPFPRYVKERYMKPGEAEYRYENVDGRKYATGLLNPDTFPGTDWRAQLQEGQTGNGDMTGMNMNAFGVFWSELAPDDPGLKEQIKLFRARLDKTMDSFVKDGNRLNAAGRLGDITANHHFAMEYFGLTAAWHMSHRHQTACPNCGDMIPEGVSYHRNASGDICVIDRERYEASVIPSSKQTESAGAAVAQPKQRRTRT